MLPWKEIARAVTPDGAPLVLSRRGEEFFIRVDGHDLMSNADEGSSRALADLGCAHLDRSRPARVLVGGLGMGYTLRAALDRLGSQAVVELAELVPAVVDWNRSHLGDLADHPLDDSRVELFVGDVRLQIKRARARYDAILLDVDNGPDALSQPANDALYSHRGLAAAHAALGPAGVLAVWSYSDDRGFTRRLERRGFVARVHRVPASRQGRGRYHFIWVARRSE